MQHPHRTLLTFYRAHHRLPTYREMMKLFDYHSTNAVYRRVNKLIESRWLAKDAQGKLIPGKRFYELKLLGAVEAGWPSAAEEELVNTMSLDEFLVGNREATYMLTVSGDSMIDAGIHPGDILLVEQGRTPKPGDIVIAEVDHGWTVKYLRRRGATSYLEPANKKYAPIYAREELTIAAVVTAVIRKYQRV